MGILKGMKEVENNDVRVYSIKDNLVGRYMAPFYAESDEEAIRFFKTQINTIPLWKNNANDFELYHLGNFDQKNGLYYNIEENCKIIDGKSVKE